MKFAAAFTTISAFSGAAVGAAINARDTCLAEYGVCYEPGAPEPAGPCCEGLICVADRCRKPSDLIHTPTATATPEPTCLAEYGTCYIPGAPQPAEGCCEGLICVADRCRKPSDLIHTPTTMATATPEPTCLAKNAICYIPGPVEQPGACCDGLICAADRCRDPNEEAIKPTPSA